MNAIKSSSENYIQRIDKSRENFEILQNHICQLIKTRQLVLTGDSSHLSIRNIKDLFDKIDAPKEYDWEADDCNEEYFMSAIKRITGHAYSVFDIDVINTNTVINGSTSHTFGNGYSEYKCVDCETKILMTLCGNTLHLFGEQECSSNLVFSVEIDFPTGEIVFGDWPDRFSEAQSEGMFPHNQLSVNYFKGCRNSTELFSTKQIFHHSVGNTSPSWYYNSKTDVITIGYYPEEDTDGNKIAQIPDLECMGHFCTDLWWVTMLDMKYYNEIINSLPTVRNEDYYSKDLDIAKVKAGRYRFTCYAKDDELSIYATAQRIGECTSEPPIFNPLYGKKLLNFNQVLQQRITNYKDFHPDNIKFNVMDGIINDTRDKNDLIKQYTIGENEFISDQIDYSICASEFIPNIPVKQFFWDRFNIIYNVSLDFFDTTWIDAFIYYYEECKKFYVNGALEARSHPQNIKPDDFENRIPGMRKAGQTDEEFYKMISANYDTPYDGDFAKFIMLKWDKEKLKNIEFFDETLKLLYDHRDKNEIGMYE